MAHRLHERAREFTQVPLRAIPKAAKEVDQVARLHARVATGDGRMSSVGRRGALLRTVTKVRPRGRTVAADIVGVPAGPWAILHGGATPHQIQAKARRRRRGGVMISTRAVPGALRHGVRGVIAHPGSRGKRTWDRVLDHARRSVPDVIAGEVDRIL